MKRAAEGIENTVEKRMRATVLPAVDFPNEILQILWYLLHNAKDPTVVAFSHTSTSFLSLFVRTLSIVHTHLILILITLAPHPCPILIPTYPHSVLILILTPFPCFLTL
jgi:hypothetical protein